MTMRPPMSSDEEDDYDGFSFGTEFEVCEIFLLLVLTIGLSKSCNKETGKKSSTDFIAMAAKTTTGRRRFELFSSQCKDW